MKERKKHKIGTLDDAQATAIGALALVARIRAAVGDSEGRLMQDELVEHCRTLAEQATQLREAKRIGDMLEPYAREHGSGMSEQLAEEWRKLAEQVRVNHDRAEEIIRAREQTIERLHEKIEKLTVALKDAISTYDPNRAVTLVSAERQEAWNAALLW